MSLQRWRIIRASRQFAAVRKHGKTYVGRYFLLGVLKGGEAGEVTRWGFVTPRYVGKAVSRNLLRRRMKHMVGMEIEACADGYFVVLVARRSAAQAGFAALQRDWLALARKAGFLKGRGHGLPPMVTGSEDQLAPDDEKAD